MITSCPECNGKVSSEAESCPHCGYRQKPAEPLAPSRAPEVQVIRIPCPHCGNSIAAGAAVCRFCHGSLVAGSPPPLRPAEAPAQTGSLDVNPKRNARQIVVILMVLVCIGVAWFVYQAVQRASSSGGGGSGSPFSMGGLTGPKVLIDETEQVVDNKWVVYRFRLESRADVSLSIEVTQGAGVTFYTMDASQYDSFGDAQKSLFGGQFLYKAGISAENSKFHSASGGLPPGEYVFVIKEKSDPNLIGGSDTAMVKIRLGVPRAVTGKSAVNELDRPRF